jgi:DNA excision repair protein ERCC-1
VEEPFRVRKAAARRGKGGEGAVPLSRVPLREMAGRERGGEGQVVGIGAKPRTAGGDDEEDEEAMIAAAIEASKKTAAAEGVDGPPVERPRNEELSGGVAAALARLRENG